MYVRVKCMVSIFLVNLFSLLLPIFIENAIKKRKRHFDLLTNTLNCLSSGIFFGTITLDLWPAAMETLTNETDHTRITNTQFPVESFSIGLGFFLIFILEQVLNNHSHVHNSSNTNSNSKKNIFIIIISLSAHSFFDGLILGTKSTENDMWSFLFIISLHHFPMSFSIGCLLNSYFNSDNERNIRNFSTRHVLFKIMVSAILWSIMIPLGILVTMFQEQIDQFSTGVLINIATGSFLYITFIELLPETINNIVLPFKLNVICLLFGYLVILVFKSYMGHHH